MGRCVHPSPLGSLAHTLGVVGIIRGRWVLSHESWGSLDTSGVIRLRFTDRKVHSRSLVSLARALGVVGFVCTGLVSRLVHHELLGSLAYALVIVGFIPGRWIR